MSLCQIYLAYSNDIYILPMTHILKEGNWWVCYEDHVFHLRLTSFLSKKTLRPPIALVVAAMPFQRPQAQVFEVNENTVPDLTSVNVNWKCFTAVLVNVFFDLVAVCHPQTDPCWMLVAYSLAGGILRHSVFNSSHVVLLIFLPICITNPNDAKMLWIIQIPFSNCLMEQQIFFSEDQQLSYNISTPSGSLCKAQLLTLNTLS